MKTIDYKRAMLAALIVWTLGVSAFVTSYFIPLMDDPDAQANWLLTLAILPAAMLGARYYYRKGHRTNGIKLGAFMFLLTIVLDASITVPVFIMPYGGDHVSFFGDPGFWLIGAEYIVVISAYWFIRKRSASLRFSNS